MVATEGDGTAAEGTAGEDTAGEDTAGEDTAQRAEMLVNRVRKRARHLRKWAKRENVTCFRVYDRDIPQIPLVIDWYDGRLHIAAFEREGLDDESALATLSAAVADALGVKRDSAFLKSRRRQKGSEQYEKLARDSQRWVVVEDGLKFYINLGDYLDTGLFLDHRLLRSRVRKEVAGKRFLNLFAYTGSFTVYAAAGGAAETDTVDLSKNYLSWARDNLAVNGFGGAQHRFHSVDATEFLRDPERSGRFDVAVLDPPTFSNSKRMEGTLDIQRDHESLINAALAVLCPNGLLYFSTNRRKFRLDAAALEARSIEEITRQTTSPDFTKRPSHRAWRMLR